jgi:hypothetical protein
MPLSINPCHGRMSDSKNGPEKDVPKVRYPWNVPAMRQALFVSGQEKNT